MHVEIRHLRTIRAVHEEGGLQKAANRLNMTQSALSHQIKALEEQTGVELFLRRSKPLKLSVAGLRMLRFAEQVLPELQRLSEDFDALRNGKSGRLHIAIECHACFEWLFIVLKQFRKAWPDIDVDIRVNLAFGAITALEREDVDLVISSDASGAPLLTFSPLFDYEPLFVASASHPAAAKAYVEPEDFIGEQLITYPVDRAKLDVFTQFLQPAGVEPRSIRRTELTEVILMLVASGRGVTVLPDWVLREAKESSEFTVKKLGPNGLFNRLHAVTRSDDLAKPHIAHFLRLARSEPVKLQRS
ncbi:MAG: LysR family transcriptional regulator [Halocynthiibacter sp.]